MKKSFVTPEGKINVSGIAQALQIDVDRLGEIYSEVKKLSPLVAKLRTQRYVLDKENMDNLYASMKIMIKSFPPEPRRVLRLLVLDRLLVEMEKKNTDQETMVLIKDTEKALKDTVEAIKSNRITREKAMIDGLTKGAEPRQIRHSLSQAIRIQSARLIP